MLSRPIWSNSSSIGLASRLASVSGYDLTVVPGHFGGHWIRLRPRTPLIAINAAGPTVATLLNMARRE
jgi:hypothetical protein